MSSWSQWNAWRDHCVCKHISGTVNYQLGYLIQRHRRWNLALGMDAAIVLNLFYDCIIVFMVSCTFKSINIF